MIHSLDAALSDLNHAKGARATGSSVNPPRLSWFTLQLIPARDYARPQFVMVQVTYLAGVTLIFLADYSTGSIERRLLYLWFAESLANFILRNALFAMFWRAPKEIKEASVIWRLVPAFSAVIVGLHWAWTGFLFLGHALTFTTFITLVVFVLMSIASTMIAPASPAAAIIYVVAIWIPAGIELLRSDWVHAQGFAILFSGVGIVLGINFWSAFGQVRRYLMKSEQVESLVHQLQTSNGELERLRSAALSELEERTQFFNGASHDFAQRLHGMKLLAHAWQNNPVHETATSVKLSEAMDDLERYVRDVLDFARIESAMLTPSKKRIHLQDLFQTLNVHFEPFADVRGIQLRFRATMAEIDTDQAMLQRILENLISNAIKFTRKGVLIGTRKCGNGCSIEVWDQGPGIPPEAREVIFEAFYQHPVHASWRSEGVGLGLTVVRRLADCLQYDVKVYSKEGAGSVIKITVPQLAVKA